MLEMSGPTVNLTAAAAVKGFVQNPTERLRANGIYTFLGIPYASPPIGKLRFQPTQPIQLWNGVRECIDYGAVCPQNLDGARRFMTFDTPPKMDEDCLFLNVYTPAIDKRASLPVMVWIHGGGFMTGFGDDYEGTALCNFHDVVVVSINYRLGFFGYGVTGDIIKGNMGLYDQVEALKWVQKYIVNFGGDPNNVTIFGESAGGMSNSFHILSTEARGLFHKAICESGANGYFGVCWPKKNAVKQVMSKLRKMGLKDESSEEAIVNFMQTLSTVELIRGVTDSFMPIIDGHFVTDSPVSLYKQGKFNKDVDVMIGFNEHEGSLFVHRLIGKSVPDTLSKSKALVDIVVDVMFMRGINNSGAVKNAILNEYFKDIRDGDEDGHLRGLIEMYGDLLFNAPSIFCAKEQAKQGNGHVYVYEFTHKRPNFPYRKRWIGSDHLEEIPYVFGKPFQSKYCEAWTREDFEFSKNMMALWSNFAKTGNPNGSILKKWPEFNAESGQYMVLNPVFKVRSGHKPRRMKLWNEDIPAIVQQPTSKY